MKIEIGDDVLLYHETAQRGRSRKLRFKWIGSYEVIEVNYVNATIKKGRMLIEVHMNKLKPFY